MGSQMRKALALTKAARASSAMARASEDRAGMMAGTWWQAKPAPQPAAADPAAGEMSARRNAQYGRR